MTDEKKFKKLKILKMERELFHTFSQGERKAEVFKTSKGFEVDLHEVDDWYATRKVHGHSETYAENTAENWVLGVFDKKDVKQEELSMKLHKKEGSFYGYREKSDNYHPELD